MIEGTLNRFIKIAAVCKQGSHLPFVPFQAGRMLLSARQLARLGWLYDAFALSGSNLRTKLDYMRSHARVQTDC